MKTAYFTEDSIDAKAAAWLQDLRGRVRLRDIPFDPTASALLILDVQRYFSDPSSHAYVPSLPPVIARIEELEAAYMAAGLTVVLTRHINTESDAGMLASWWKDLITADSSEGEIVPALDVGGAIVLDKSQYDAFHGTHLEEVLRTRGVRQVVVTGVMTHLCCESTARSAFVRGFSVFLPVDGTATYNEDFHFSTLLNLAHGFAVPVLVRDILRQMEAA
jgi:bifunctional isochorismate lyase/aryl carrier protein